MLFLKLVNSFADIIKIADFGLSNVFDEKHFLNTFCGSPLYASPEIVKGTPYYGSEVIKSRNMIYENKLTPFK